MDADIIRELFQDFGPVDARRMFGGVGVFVEGLIALVTSDDLVHLNADDATIPAFRQEGLKPFSYSTSTGDHTLTSYWRIPDRLYDDPAELARWARDAHGAAVRKAAAKPRPRRSRRKT